MVRFISILITLHAKVVFEQVLSGLHFSLIVVVLLKCSSDFFDIDLSIGLFHDVVDSLHVLHRQSVCSTDCQLTLGLGNAALGALQSCELLPAAH